mmetsp:Transcript_31597/g.74361  ORF Transcript_31597/g.74361 Transcript_31597/m.74361 type:complete len:174 (+) Transcript_31597:129-650(+)
MFCLYQSSSFEDVFGSILNVGWETFLSPVAWLLLCSLTISVSTHTSFHYLSSNVNIDSCSVLKGETVGSFVSRQLLSIVVELERILVQSTSFSENGEDNAQCTLVSQGEVSFFTRSLISEEDGDWLVSSRRRRSRCFRWVYSAGRDRSLGNRGSASTTGTHVINSTGHRKPTA